MWIIKLFIAYFKNTAVTHTHMHMHALTHIHIRTKLCPKKFKIGNGKIYCKWYFKIQSKIEIIETFQPHTHTQRPMVASSVVYNFPVAIVFILYLFIDVVCVWLQV